MKMMKKILNKLKKIKENKIVSAILYVFNIIATLFIVAILCVIFVQRFSNNTFTLGGYSIFTVISNSMAPEYEVGDMLLAKETDAEEINVGDNVVYMGNAEGLNGKIVTHEVISKRIEGDKVYFVTKGIANSLEDPEITEDQVYGKVKHKFVVLSILGSIVNNNYGFYFIIFVPFVIFLFFEILDIKKEVEKRNEE